MGRRFWPAALLVALTAIASSISGVKNQYTQDDIPLIQNDARVHTLGEPLPILTGAYWPKPHGAFLYRPLTTAAFAVQWVSGGGSPVVFRLFSYLLYAAAAVAVLFLAGMLVPAGIALAVALLFAAHPVHVEAVALGVNQSEVWVGLLATVMTAIYLRSRQGGPPGPKLWVALGGLYLIACLLKENALVIPGILMAAEALLIPGRALTTRIRELWRGYAFMIVLGLGFLVARTAVVGDLVGTFAAEALAGQGIGGRTLTMLQVVPEWIRLMVWPSHLQGDYSPGVIEQATSWGVGQTLGLAIVAGLVMLGWRLRRSGPVATFGLLWVAAGIFPVSNILVPTGIVLAERTLFLPSIGVLLTIGGLADLVLRPRMAHRGVRLVLTVLVAGLVLAGAVRSGIRHTVWKNQLWYWAQTVEFDAPLSYRAHMAFAQLLYDSGLEGRSIRHYYTAMALYPPAYWVENDLANKFRLRGNCVPALALYERSLQIAPDQSATRASRIACHLYLGDYPAAIQDAEAAIAFGKDVDDFHGFRSVADSARRAGAPAGSVRLIVRDAETVWH